MIESFSGITAELSQMAKICRQLGTTQLVFLFIHTVYIPAQHSEICPQALVVESESGTLIIFQVGHQKRTRTEEEWPIVNWSENTLHHWLYYLNQQYKYVCTSCKDYLRTACITEFMFEYTKPYIVKSLI